MRGEGKPQEAFGVIHYVSASAPRGGCGVISTHTLGMAFEPEQRSEHPDGTPITFDGDYFGRHRPVNPMPGPFEGAQSAMGILFQD